MNIWYIVGEMQRCFDMSDPDTGELPPEAVEMLMNLQMEREVWAENMALVVKNELAEVAAIEAAEKDLAKRKKAAKNRAEKAKSMLAEQMDGEKLKTGRVAIGWRKSIGTVVDEGKTWRDFDRRFLTQKDPEISLAAIRKAIEAGETVPGAHLEERNNIQIR